MQFGIRDSFLYFQCSRCQCLQISHFPNNLQKYYPDSYYSYQLDLRQRGVIKWLISARNRYLLEKKGWVGKLLVVFNRFPSANKGIAALSSLPLTRSSRILDVGCGAGSMLYAIRELGFRNTLGIDPFIGANLNYRNGLNILKCNLHQVQGTWDLVMFHHSLEHMPDQFETMRKVSELLAPGGYCLLRVPTVSSYAWEHYRQNWVQLDAPRHFFLHSIASLEMIAARVGLTITNVIYDSDSFQFWGSELYQRNIPQNDKSSNSQASPASHFSRSELAAFVKKAKQLNAEGRGDQVSVYLRKARP